MNQSLLFFMRYLAEYLDNQQRLGQKVLLPQDYLSATLRCLWYLQSSSHYICSSLSEQFHAFESLQEAFGISKYLEDTSNNLTRGALHVFPMLLNQTPPSTDLFTALKRPFDGDVISRTPSSFHHVMHNIHDYLMQHDIEYQQNEHSVLAGLSGPSEDEPLVDYEALYPWIFEDSDSVVITGASFHFYQYGGEHGFDVGGRELVLSKSSFTLYGDY